MTGRKTTEDVIVARQRGTAYFITKPPTPRKLIDKIVEVLGVRRLPGSAGADLDEADLSALLIADGAAASPGS